jgi:allantoin racemase
MARIVWHVGLPRDAAGRMADHEAMWRCLEAYARWLVSDANDVDIRFAATSTGVLTHPFTALVNTAQLVGDVVGLAQEGVDAVMIGPGVDPGLQEARAAVAIPVTGTTESSLAVSMLLGRRIGVLTVNADFAAMLADALGRYGAADRLVPRPIRRFQLDYREVEASLAGDHSALWERVTAAARELVADGADVVIGAFQFLGAALWQGGLRDWTIEGAPLVDCAAAGLKVTELLLALGETPGIGKSRGPWSPYRDAAPADLAAALRLLGRP